MECLLEGGVDVLQFPFFYFFLSNLFVYCELPVYELPLEKAFRCSSNYNGRLVVEIKLLKGKTEKLKKICINLWEINLWEINETVESENLLQSSYHFFSGPTHIPNILTSR